MSSPIDFKNFLPQQRWFGGKGKSIAEVHRMLSLPLVENADWQILEISYADGTHEYYQVPQIGNADALAEAQFRMEIFALLQKTQTVSTERGEIRVAHFSAPPPCANSRLLTIEQSNSSISYGGTSFLKVFRKLEGGLNPDIEILTHLNQLPGNIRVPKIYATLSLDYRGETHALAVLLEMVANRGDAWEVALEAAKTGQDFQNEAALLGKRTAELHLALATDAEAFGISHSQEKDWSHTLETLQRDTADLLQLLKTKLPTLSEENADSVARFIAEAPTELARLSQTALTFPQIRIHGDYHLGQVLATADDFVIIDFEGEPARPLHERRQARSPLIDIAGMLRSFHYAGCLTNAFDWQKTAASAFLATYFSIVRGSRILPYDATTQTLLEVFSWQKKLYEIRYELNNRPAWLWIPLK